jgi:hypothetical protein
MTGLLKILLSIFWGFHPETKKVPRAPLSKMAQYVLPGCLRTAGKVVFVS